ncbi:MAG TPA: hypothetical protein VKB43_08390 [Gaiellaceae bacterium]|nr:hypothetical protein [Gaiellaceae bacterium]
MRFVALATIALAGVTIFTACGSAHRRTGSGGAIEIHLPTGGTYALPARSHRHSVRQVEAAFASQGIHLHRMQLPRTFDGVRRRSVLLRYGSGTNYVTVAVVGPERANNFEIFGARTGTPRPRITRDGNLIVFYSPGHSAAVKSALAELH